RGRGHHRGPLLCGVRVLRGEPRREAGGRAAPGRSHPGRGEDQGRHPPGADLPPDVAKIEAAIPPRTRAILVNSPNNPSGVIYPASIFVEIERVLGRAAQPIVLISDEPYKALVFDGVVPPEVPPLVTRSIIATSWSK